MRLMSLLSFVLGLILLVNPSCVDAWQASGNETRVAKIIRPAGLSEEEVAEGWIALYDDSTKFGWKPEAKVNWKFENGVISADEGEVGLLRTTSQFDNFILRLEYRAEKSTNSGVFIRTSPKPMNPEGDCYEINIAPADNPFPTGSLVARKKATDRRAAQDWEELEIVADGKNVTVKRNGDTVCEYEDKSPLGRGYIGLQHNSGKIEFRKIRLKPLGLNRLFNEKNLDGWKSYPEMKSKFEARDGLLQVRDGVGQLETRDSFADFVFQIACRTNDQGLNSGIFYRCIPGEKMNGYESQIQNAIKNDDAKLPVDCGTGGIFRRQNARRVNARDEEWFYKTIIAVGPHVSVWVNGLQVCDWADKRKRDKNPRRGLRLEAGTIMIQGHDPTTDLSFKNIAAAELDARRPNKKIPRKPR